MAKEYDLIQTENPYVDRVIYYLKNLASGCVLKNPTEVLNNETLESLRNADLYTHAVRGELDWGLIDILDEIKPNVSKTVLGRTKDTGLMSYYDEIIDAYILEQRNTPNTFWNNRLVAPYIDLLAYGRAVVAGVEDPFTELNGDNGIIKYLDDFKNQPVDGHPSLTYEAALYTHIAMAQSGKHNLLLVPRDEIERKSPNPDGTMVTYTDYSKGYALNSNEKEQERFLLFAMNYIVDHYEEKNNYYRMLSGRPIFDETQQMLNRIFLGISTATESYSVKYDNEKYVDVFNEFNSETDEEYAKLTVDSDGQGYWTLFGKIYIDELTDDQIQILKNYGVIDKLLEALEYNWDYKYLNFLGSDAVDPIKARSTVDFGYLHINSIDNDNIYNRFKDRLDLNRTFVIRTIYSEAYKYGSDFYDHFICILIIILSMVDVITLLQEIILNKEVLDQRIIKYIFESNGIPYYSEIPLNYQINMVKNLNTLIKYKSSNRNIVDICSLFGFDNIEVFKYYLLKIRKTDEEGNFITIDEDKSNLDEAYDLKFIKVPYDGNVVDYINDKEAEVEYEKMISGDPTWNAGKSTEYVKHQILEKEFNLVKSKYISIDSTFDIAEATTQIAYLMDLMYADKEQEDGSLNYLCKGITVPFQNAQIPIGDMFLYLFALTFYYYGTKSATPTEFGYNLAVHGESITGTAYNTNSRSERYLALDINQDLARLATLIQAKLNKNIVASIQTYAVGDSTETTYILQLSGISKTFQLTEDEYKTVLDNDEHLYIYQSGGSEKTIQFTEEELAEVRTVGNYRIITHTYGSGDYDNIILTKDEFQHYVSDMDITKSFELTKAEYDELLKEAENPEDQYKYIYESGNGNITITFTIEELQAVEISGDKYIVTHTFKGNEYDETADVGFPKVRMFYDPDDKCWKNIISVYYFDKNEYIGDESFEANTLYIVNNKTKRVIKYRHPVDPFTNVPDLYEFLNNDSNSSGAMINRLLLQTAMIEAQSIEEYNIYRWVYDSIMVSNRIKSYFATGEYEDDGITPKYYQDYKSYLGKYGVLFTNLDRIETMMEDATMDDSIRKETISSMINNAISALESVDFSQYFEYAYNGIATVSGDYLASYIVKLIEFFKSYKVDIYDINAVYKFDDHFNNTVIMIDQIDRITTSLDGLKDIHYDTFGEELSDIDRKTRISQILQVFKPEDWESPNGEAQFRNVDNGIALLASDTKAFLADKFNGHSAIFDILVELLKYKVFGEDYHPEILSDEYNPNNNNSIDILKYSMGMGYNEINDSRISFTQNAYFDYYEYYDDWENMWWYEFNIYLGEIACKDGYDTFIGIKNHPNDINNSVFNLSYYTYNTPSTTNYHGVGNSIVEVSQCSFPKIACIIPNEANHFGERNLEVDIGLSYSGKVNVDDMEVSIYYIPVSLRNEYVNPIYRIISLESDSNRYDTDMIRDYNLPLSDIEYLNNLDSRNEQFISKLFASAHRYLLDGSIDTESGEYYGDKVETSEGIVRKILYSYVNIIMKRTFGTIENVNDLITKLNVTIGSSDFMNDKYTMTDIAYLMVYYTTRIFLTNKVLTITKFEEETQTQETYISNTAQWKDPNWANMSVEEKEEFYKELEVLDDIILKTTLRYNDKYYNTLSDEEKSTLEIVVKSITSVLRFTSKDLYKQAATKDDMNFDLDSAEVYKLLMCYDPKELYIQNYLKTQIKEVISNIVFGKDTYKVLDIGRYKLNGSYLFNDSSDCTKYVTSPITLQTATTLYPYNFGSGSYSTYNYIPVDFTKYRYYYTGAKANGELVNPTAFTLYFIGFFTDRWENKTTAMEPYKEMVYATNFKMLPSDYGFYEIIPDKSIIENLGFSIEDIKFITFTMYDDSTFKLYRCLKPSLEQDPATGNYINVMEYDSNAEMVKIYDEFHCDMDFKTGEIVSISDLFGNRKSSKSVSDNLNLADQIYIEEA